MYAARSQRYALESRLKASDARSAEIENRVRRREWQCERNEGRAGKNRNRNGQSNEVEERKLCLSFGINQGPATDANYRCLVLKERRRASPLRRRRDANEERIQPRRYGCGALIVSKSKLQVRDGGRQRAGERSGEK